MKKLSPGDETYDYKFTTLKENVEHHAEEEEKEMFPKVREKLPRLDEIGHQMMERKQELKEQLTKRSNSRSRSTSSGAKSSRSSTRSTSRSRSR